MKTTKILTVISLALMFAGVNAVYAKGGPDKTKPISKPAIRYEVTVHLALPLGTTLCNTYWVKVTDEFGRAVAPAQKFVPGVSKYVFNESISATGSIRIASLTLPSNVDPFACMNILVTKPDARRDFFKAGHTYSFDLYPTLQKGSLDE